MLKRKSLGLALLVLSFHANADTAISQASPVAQNNSAKSVQANQVTGSQHQNRRNGQGENFEQHKQNMLAKMQQHASMIQNNKSCVQSATNHDALKLCMRAVKAAHESMRQQDQESHGGNQQNEQQGGRRDW